MGDRRGHADRSKDEEFEEQRHARFGKLPDRVEPEDLVETADTDPPREEPPEPPVRREWI
ncbi:hypothetical protein [Micromonospora sp. NPDC051006]|uniref:hypothetical protein n=1 Tax=Micromonospora sp. NPDC051006 TaxID=3364283 RepID=UPI0037AD2D23